MKLPGNSWKKLRRWRSGYNDPQTRHVEKALKKDVQRRPPISEDEDWYALSTLRSQHGNNEAPSAPVPRMTELPVAGALDVSNGSQGNETSAKYDASAFTDETTRVESSPRHNGLRHNTKEPEANPSSTTFHASPMNYHPPERRDSPTLIREFSPDGHMTILLDLRGRSQASENLLERPDHTNSISLGQGQSGFFYDEVYPSDSNFLKSVESETNSDTEDPVESTVNRPYSSDHGLDLEKHPESVREDQSHSQSIPYKQPQGAPILVEPHRSEPYSERTHPEFVTSDIRNLSESTSQNLDQPELTADRRDFVEYILDRQADPGRFLDQQGYEECDSKGQDLSTSVGVKLDHAETFLQGANRLEPALPQQDQEKFTSDKQSHPESLRSQKSLTVKDQQRRLRREAKLHNLLSRNLQTRARAYEKRSQLRLSRSEISNADEAFMKLIREKRFQGNHDDVVLQASFEKLQETRNKYGPLEEAYNAIEEQLNREEYETKELEDKILKSEISVSDFDIDSHSTSPSEDDSEAPGFVRDVFHPLYEAYLSRLGDADLCREEIAEIMIEHDNLLQTQEARQRVGVELSLDDQVTLQNFPIAEAKLVDELTRIEADVEHLRLECAREGLFGENEVDDGDVSEVEAEFEDIDLLMPPIGSVETIQPEYDKYAILLEKPQEKEEENKSRVLLTDFKQGDVGDRITCWLLHKLRSSGLEVELLARLAGGLERSAATEKWQEEVLEFWFFDSANLPASAYKVEPTLTAYPPSPLTDLKKISNHFSNSQLIQLVVRSSALSKKLEFGMWLKLTRMKGKSAMTM